ncbi:conserved hypothetical protein [Paenibacillus curdlanolyticus YK9]|uniref:Coat F domain protein n=2 Tax=Paenibacillus curdlanolyticus TaxID=59840 RepID=E0IBM9_9BACL|nr:conserved hypothetical protein [Paenibacillus curdlanolyticus YK9]
MTPNQMIQNPSASQPQAAGPELSDRDRLTEILATEKYLTDSLNIAAKEASHASLHNDVMTVLTETHQMQVELFELMFAKGFYKLEAEEQQKLDQAYQQFSGFSNQFPYSGGTLQ